MIKSYHFPKKTIKDLSVSGKRILLRADFNVPLDENGNITSDFRIQATLPTIEYLTKHGAEVIVLAHLGRPDGVVKAELSLEPIAKHLSKLLKNTVEFIGQCVGDQVIQALKFIHPGKITVLENVRFHKEEEENDPGFAKRLIESIRPDFVVQDGFGVVHRAHASTEGISHLKPAVAGLLLEQEVVHLETAIAHPSRPLVAVLGGAKIADKLPLIERFINEADAILVGGALANTFLKFTGHSIGNSIYEAEQEVQVKRILKQAKPEQLVLPNDVGVAKEVSQHTSRHEATIDSVKEYEYILDIGRVSADLFAHHVENAGTVIWNGTLGYAENPHFAKASAVMADVLSRNPSITSIIGGGDTVDFVLEWQKGNKGRKFTHISTGGGASLELLSGKKLPGVEALIDV